jgi:hypothetical protein
MQHTQIIEIKRFNARFEGRRNLNQQNTDFCLFKFLQFN